MACSPSPRPQPLRRPPRRWSTFRRRAAGRQRFLYVRPDHPVTIVEMSGGSGIPQHQGRRVDGVDRLAMRSGCSPIARPLPIADSRSRSSTRPRMARSGGSSTSRSLRHVRAVDTVRCGSSAAARARRRSPSCHPPASGDPTGAIFYLPTTRSDAGSVDHAPCDGDLSSAGSGQFSGQVFAALTSARSRSASV